MNFEIFDKNQSKPSVKHSLRISFKKSHPNNKSKKFYCDKVGVPVNLIVVLGWSQRQQNRKRNFQQDVSKQHQERNIRL